MARAPAAFSEALLLALALSSSLPRAASGACFLERGVTTPGEHDMFTCLRSRDFRRDLERLPLNGTKLVNVSFRDSKVPRIERDDLQKLGAKALGLSVVHCGLEDVHAEAFRGLTEMKGLILRRNRLAEVKKEWFKDLGKLESLDLSGNRIRQFDPAIFELTPRVQEFEISENLLTHFDIDAMKAKWPKMKRLGLQWNPYEWGQGVKIIDYSNLYPSVVKNSYTSVDGIRDTSKLVKECQTSVANKEDAKALDECVRAKLDKAVETPKLLEGEKSVEPVKPIQ